MLVHKLKLSKETLRELSSPELSEVGGGTHTTWTTIEATIAYIEWKFSTGGCDFTAGCPLTSDTWCG